MSATTTTALRGLGLSTAFILSGTAFCASHLTIPSLYGIDTKASTAAFKTFYLRGAYTLVPLSVISGLLTGAAAILDPERRLALATSAFLVLTPIPWTTTIMMSTNKTLVALSESDVEREKAGAGKVAQLLYSWQWMNFVRSGMYFSAGAVGLWSVLD